MPIIPWLLIFFFFRRMEIVVRDVTFRNKVLYFIEPLFSASSLNSNVFFGEGWVLPKFSLQI